MQSAQTNHITTFEIKTFPKIENRDSSVGIATGYGLEDGGIGVRVTVKQKYSPLRVVQTGSVVHPTSYTMGTRGSFLGGKATGA
jgi:hypothetical protein